MCDKIILGDIMKIDKLKKLSNGKYKLMLSDGSTIITYDEVILDNNLLYSKEIDNDLLNKLEIDNNYYDLYNKCINLINKRIRSKKEVREYLIKYTSDTKEIDSIINKLSDIGLINDLAYTKALISDRVNLANEGPLKIARTLYDNDISSSVIEDEISKIDECLLNDKIDKYIAHKVSNNTKYSSYILKEKIINELMTKGYAKDMIVDILNKYTITSNIDKEVIKQYNKLVLKYSGDELLSKLKTKLYQKGYSSSEINESIKKWIIKIHFFSNYYLKCHIFRLI